MVVDDLALGDRGETGQTDAGDVTGKGARSPGMPQVDVAGGGVPTQSANGCGALPWMTESGPERRDAALVRAMSVASRCAHDPLSPLSPSRWRRSRWTCRSMRRSPDGSPVRPGAGDRDPGRTLWSRVHRTMWPPTSLHVCICSMASIPRPVVDGLSTVASCHCVEMDGGRPPPHTPPVEGRGQGQAPVDGRGPPTGRPASPRPATRLGPCPRR